MHSQDEEITNQGSAKIGHGRWQLKIHSQSEEIAYLNTADLARSLGVLPATIRRALCVHGHYLGLRPIKLPNNRLLWPVEGRDRLLNLGGEESN